MFNCHEYDAITLCPPRCFTTHVKWAERPAATVMLFNGDINPGSTPVTAGGTNDENKNNIIHLPIWKVELLSISWLHNSISNWAYYLTVATEAEST